MNPRTRQVRRQTIVEYVLIIAIVVIAAIGILSMFSDTVRGKISGIIKVFDPSANTSTEIDQGSKDIMQQLNKDGLQGGGGAAP